MFGVAKNVTKSLTESMENWKIELSATGEVLGDVSMRKSIFQEDILSPFIFV